MGFDSQPMGCGRDAGTGIRVFGLQMPDTSVFFQAAAVVSGL